MKHLKFLIVFLALTSSVAIAQPKLETGITFSSGFPQSGFGKNVDRTGFGMTFDFFYRLSQSPYYLGGSLGFLEYGSQKRTEILSPNIPDVLVSVNTTNNILLTHFIFRYQPVTKRALSPYVEALFGFNYLWTQTSVGGGSDQLISTNFNDSTLSYGGGGGVSFRLLQGGMRNFGPSYRMDLNVGVRYLIGGKAEYLTKGSIREEDGELFYDVHQSRTNILLTNIGIGFSF